MSKSVKPLDIINYTLTYSNPGSATVLNAVLVDNLPPKGQMSYVANSATSGGVYDPNANTLTWTIPSIPPGASFAVTYSIQAGFEAATNAVSILVNKACLTFSSGVVCDSKSVTVFGAYVVHLAIYNQAGELIKDLVTFESAAAVNDFNIVNGVITTDSQIAQFYYKGMPIGSWDATNPNGVKVTNGTYLVKITSTDPYGVTTSVNQNVSVIIGRNTLQLAVYNEAGEIVKHFTQTEIQNLIAGSGGSLLPADYDVGKIKISSTTLSPSYSNTTGPNQTLTVTLGSGRSFTWDGRGDNGNILTTGTYFLEVESALQDKPKEQVVMSIHLQDTNATGAGEVVLGPNPVKLTQTKLANFYINNLSNEVTGITVKIYTVAGELTQTLQNTPGNLTMVAWDLSQGSVASGTYFAVVEMHSPTGVISRKIVQVVVIH